MTQYLVGQGYWSYINDAQENRPDSKNAHYSTWEQATSRVMYFLVTCDHNHMLRHIQDSKMPKEVWANLKKFFAMNTMACKLHL